MSIDPLKYYHKLEETGILFIPLSQLNDSTYLYMDQVETKPKFSRFFQKKRKTMKLTLERF